MLRSRTLVAVGQHQRQCTQASPLGFTGTYELVNDHLGAIDEITELALPDHQAMRIGRRIAILESDDRLFRQY